MRFRKKEWDVAMPPALVDYWTAWNEHDAALLPDLLDRAVSDDVIWNDPRDSFVGKSGLQKLMAELHSTKPDYRFAIVSEIDGHHDRYRYRWDMVRRDRVLMEGLDVTTIDPNTGLIVRVDGFFGAPTPRLAESSGVPTSLHHHG